MPPLVIAGAVIVGLAATGYTAKSLADLFKEANGLTKTVVVGGVVYVSYRALKANGALK